MPSELSGGMRKRVGIARAIALEPKILLYDEPTTGLDPVTTYAIDSLIVDLRKSLGVTSLIVSHDVTSVYRVADRIAFLEQGKLSFLGAPKDFGSARSAAIQELLQKAEARSLRT
jgi:phospholipid/cholesterol/gamma-HCH transport system ATP-binding protein